MASSSIFTHSPVRWRLENGLGIQCHFARVLHRLLQNALWPPSRATIACDSGHHPYPQRTKQLHRTLQSQSSRKKRPHILSNGKERRAYLRPLADKQGWQTLRFPPFRAKIITLEFPQITRSSSKGADFCLSEIELRNGERKIPWNMPRPAMYYDGLEGDAHAPLLIKRDGTPLNGIAMDVGYQDTWIPSSRYVAGVIGEKKGERLWIYDAVRGVKISKSSHPSMSQKDSEWLKRFSQGT